MRPQLEKVEWTLNDIPVLVEDWNTTERANFGFDTMSGVIDAGWGEVEQGMPIAGYSTDGEVVWAGRVVAPAKRVKGRAFLEGVGYGQILAKQGSQELVQSADLRDWQIEAGTAGGSMRPEFAHGVALWALAKGASIPSSSEEGISFVVDSSQTITRIAFDVNTAGTAGDLTNVRLRLYGGTSYPLTQIGSDITLSGSKDLTISTTPTIIALRLRNTAGVTLTTTTNDFIWLENLRVNGDYAGDSIGTADVVSKVSGRLQLDNTDGIQAGVVPANPLFWRGNFELLFDWLAHWDNYRWMVWENRRGLGPVIEYGPWGPTYTAYLSDGMIEDLDPVELYNVARVQYDLVTGESQTLYLTADPDPLEKYGVRNELPITLPERQLDAASATSLATRALDYYSTPRVRGSVMIGAATDEAGAAISPRRIRAGSMLYIGDYDPAIPAQRIVAKSMTATTCSFSITETDPMYGRAGLPQLFSDPSSTRVVGTTHQHLIGDPLPDWIDPALLRFSTGDWINAHLNGRGGPMNNAPIQFYIDAGLVGSKGPPAEAPFEAPKIQFSKQEKRWAQYQRYLSLGGEMTFADFIKVQGWDLPMMQ